MLPRLVVGVLQRHPKALGLSRLQLWKILPLVVMAAGLGWEPLSQWAPQGCHFCLTQTVRVASGLCRVASDALGGASRWLSPFHHPLARKTTVLRVYSFGLQLCHMVVVS